MKSKSISLRIEEVADLMSSKISKAKKDQIVKDAKKRKEIEIKIEIPSSKIQELRIQMMQAIDEGDFNLVSELTDRIYAIIEKIGIPAKRPPLPWE